MNNKFFRISVLLHFLILTGFAQTTNKVFVDEAGILRWISDSTDVALFGINYSVPFAHAYRSIEKLGYSHKDAIDMDVNQFARLELDAYRIHIWDREISDKEGNLDENIHIELLDYLIYKLKQKNISILLTPIAWWGTGWPEPDPDTKGFSTFYSKVELVTDPEARKAQKNYIKQILNHTNIYTKISYKDDPDIIAFEIINEPGHPDDIKMTTEYINEMAKVFRDEGVSKPIYYNISQNWSDAQAEAVYMADIDGISFQWYPTGLVKYSGLEGNYLPHVDHYPIPEIDDRKFKSKTRMVYEFDAADVAKPIMYPAMARSFREAGMQWATMFAYDATYLASFNTEYNTHYVNLLYTPAKAISLMIAANVFREVDVYQKFNSFPVNTEFDGFRISYKDNLSEYAGNNRFYYTNDTKNIPENIESIKHIAGIGSSPLIQYNGTGAYFFDKISDGTWRVEIYPDAVSLADPFGRNSLDRKVTDLLYNESRMGVKIDELGSKFSIYPLLSESGVLKADNRIVKLKPGVYIFSKNEIGEPSELSFNFRGLSLSDYTNIKGSTFTTHVVNKTPNSFVEGQKPEFSIKVFSDKQIDSVKVFAKRKGWRGFASAVMTNIDKYEYTGFPERFSTDPGQIEYCYGIYFENEYFTYPGFKEQYPEQWDFEHDALFVLNILPEENNYVLFNPEINFEDIILPPVWGTARMNFDLITNSMNYLSAGFELSNFRNYIDNFTFQIDAGIDLNKPIFKKYNNYEIELTDLAGFDSVYFAVVDFEGRAKGAWFKSLYPETKATISFEKLQNSDFMLLPRPYPHFLPLIFEGQAENRTSIMNTISYFQFKVPIQKAELDKINIRFKLGRIKLAE